MVHFNSSQQLSELLRLLQSSQKLLIQKQKIFLEAIFHLGSDVGGGLASVHHFSHISSLAHGPEGDFSDFKNL